MKRPLAMLALAALVACGAPQPSGPTVSEALYPEDLPPGHERPPRERAGETRDVTARERAAIGRLSRIAERVRGLRFRHEVPVQVQDPEAIMAYVDSQIEDQELQRARTVYVALGLLSPDLDVRSLLLRLMGEQIVGYYDSDAGNLVVRDDVMRAFGGAEGEEVDLDEARIVLVHELVHALQDQQLSLSANLEGARTTDAENAFRALVEGDATLAMIGFALEGERVPLSHLTMDAARIHNLSEMVRGSPLTGSELTNAPAIVRVPLLSAYVDGLSFAANLHGSGGWGKVDRAHAEPPESTEQVLHPARFARREAPERLRLRGAEGLLGEGRELVYEDTLGELEMSVYFRLGASPPEAARGAEGWGGDRLYAFERPDGGSALVWLMTWDSEAEAREAQALAETAVKATPAGQPRSHRVERRGRALLVLRHVTPELQDPVVERFAEWARATKRAD